MRSFTSTTVRAILILGLVGGATAEAGPITYQINFLTTSGLGLFPSSGSFTYDPSAGFFNFHVTYGAVDYDLTAAANSPVHSANAPPACSTPNAASGFLLLNGGCFGVIWTGNATEVSFDSIDGPTILSPTIPNHSLDGVQGPIATPGSGGSISLSVLTPEPATIETLVLGGLTLIALARRRSQ